MLNTKLERIHRIISYAYLSFAGLGALLVIGSLIVGRADEMGFGNVCIVVFGPIGLYHWYAAKGAAAGTRWGRNMSRGIACIFLIGFPIGTLLGIYMLNKTGTIWESGQRI